MEKMFTRRCFLKLGIFSATPILFPCSSLASLNGERSLSFYNTHTGESLKTAYWDRGGYIPEALAEINHILRDYRINEVKPIDFYLLDMLFAIRQELEPRNPFRIISGYRSPETNALLRKWNRGVDKNSFHIYGQAADFRIPGFELSSIRQVALGLRKGGVGYYPHSDFVHVDVGRFRYW